MSRPLSSSFGLLHNYLFETGSTKCMKKVMQAYQKPIRIFSVAISVARKYTVSRRESPRVSKLSTTQPTAVWQNLPRLQHN